MVCGRAACARVLTCPRATQACPSNSSRTSSAHSCEASARLFAHWRPSLCRCVGVVTVAAGGKRRPRPAHAVMCRACAVSVVDGKVGHGLPGAVGGALRDRPELSPPSPCGKCSQPTVTPVHDPCSISVADTTRWRWLCGRQVRRSMPGSDASGKLEEGDLLLAINGETMVSYRDVEIAVNKATAAEPGAQASVTVTCVAGAAWSE